MALFQRRERVPAQLSAMLPVRERVVSWADTETGSFVAATPTGLWWPDAAGLRCIGWERIDKAVWRDGALMVIEADVVDDVFLVDRPPVLVALGTPRDLPPTVRKRVESNIVRSELHTVPGGSARFVARRIPGQDGLMWWARLEDGVDATDEAVRQHVRTRVEALRAAAGADQAW
jgi:hypothetical protein